MFKTNNAGFDLKKIYLMISWHRAYGYILDTPIPSYPQNDNKKKYLHLHYYILTDKEKEGYDYDP